MNFAKIVVKWQKNTILIKYWIRKVRKGEKEIKDIQERGGADVVIDFGASQSGFHLADSLVKQAGKFVIGSFHRTDMTFNGPKWHLGGITVYNLSPMSNTHYTEMLPRAYELIKRGVYEREN